MANLYANVTHAGDDELARCLELITSRAADVMKLADRQVAVGAQADLVCLSVGDPAEAVARIAPAIWALKAGRQSFERSPVRMLTAAG